MSSNNNKKSCSSGLADRLRRARKEAGLTQQEAAQLGGVSVQSWRDYEADRAEPKICTIMFLYQKNISLSWLIAGEGPIRSGEQGQEEIKTSANTTHSLTERRKQKRRQADGFSATINEQLLPINEWLEQLPIIDRLDFLNDFRARFSDFELFWQKKTGRDFGDDIGIDEDITA